MADKNIIIKEAQKYLAKGQIDKAILEWEKLIKESPDGNTYNIVGDLYLKKGDKKNSVESYIKAANFFRNEGFSLKALALYKKVLNINSNDINALYSLGELSEEKGLITDAIKYYLATADSYSKDGKKDKILNIYEKILSLSPSNIPLRNKVAEIFLKEGLKSDASKEYIYIARSYDENGDIQNSKEYYQKVLNIQPLNKEAVLGISYLYEKTGEIKNAIEHMKEATALFPENADVMLRCAEVLLIGGDSDSARDYLCKAIEKEPSNLKSRRLLGEIYLKDGLKEKAWVEYLPVLDEMILNEKYEGALKLLESFKEIDPVETGRRLVSLYSQLGEKDHMAEELISLGDALEAKDMNDEALSCYKEAYEITPDNEYLRGKVAETIEKPEAEDDTDLEHISIKSGKSVDEVFTEADIFARYGLMSEALRLLEGMKLREPDNIDLHLRLKSIYTDTSDKELAVTECLILKELYRRKGDIDNAEKISKDAYEINSEDPRLTEMAGKQMHDAETYAAVSEEFAGTTAFEQSIEDYEEEISEADFYMRQGLHVEAAKILERLHELFPDNMEINERLSSFGEITEFPEREEIKEKFEQANGKSEFEDVIFTEQDLIEAQEMPEPELDNDVLEIFQEFKRGLEKELGDEDSETHYNLGIAYKEMGLIDDAVKEFQTSRNDPKRFIQSSTMLGVCYMEKGLYSLAIDALNRALKAVSSDDEAYAIKYELAEAYEKNNNLKDALGLYTEVFGWNAKFRNVSEKVSQVNVQIAKGSEREKPKERKDRVSYL